MTLLYGRKIEVAVAGLTISAPRINVSLNRQIDKTQDKGQCTIYNLSPEHEQQIYDRGEDISIQAGYPETLATLFEGTVQRVLRPRKGLAKLTEIQLGDAVRSKTTLSGVYSGSFRGLMPIRWLARDIIRNGLGLREGPLDNIPPPATYFEFYYLGGPATVALDTVLRRVNCTWWNNDGIIRINRVGMPQPDAPGVSKTPENGLIGIPTVTDEGAEAQMLLDPLVQVGGLLSIKSKALSGTWKVVGVSHEADNWEGAFVTSVDLRSL